MRKVRVPSVGDVRGGQRSAAALHISVGRVEFLNVDTPRSHRLVWGTWRARGF